MASVAMVAIGDLVPCILQYTYHVFRSAAAWSGRKTVRDPLRNHPKMAAWQCEELYLNNVAGDVTEAELLQLFSTFGAVKEIVFVSKIRAVKQSQAVIVR